MDQIERKVLSAYSYLHSYPELSWKEENTTNYIAKILKENNCKVTTFEESTGVIGEYGNFNSEIPVVAIRADMDALWQEVEGKFQANHSCGHDAHMAIVLGVLWKLQNHPEIKDKIAIKFIFQPAEEEGAGALKMIENNVIDNVDYLFGLHLRPIQEMSYGYASPVIIHGANKEVQAKIIGEDAHAARPHLNNNAIEIGALIVSMLSNIHLDPNTPYSIKMTKFQAGGKNTNIIPGSATFALDLRAQNNKLMLDLWREVEKIFNVIRKLYNIEIEIISNSGVPAAEINVDAIKIMSNAIKQVLGEEQLINSFLTSGGDDFHFYAIKKPSVKATMLGLGADLSPGLHHPDMTFNKNILIKGVQILYQAILETYNI